MALIKDRCDGRQSRIVARATEDVENLSQHQKKANCLYNMIGISSTFETTRISRPLESEPRMMTHFLEPLTSICKASVNVFDVPDADATIVAT